MNANRTRLDISIDVVGLPGQRALVQADLCPPVLVAAGLDELRELEYLGDRPADYRLVRVANGEALDEQQPLGAQLQTGDHLALEERLAPLPEGAARPSRPLYLRERSTGQVF